MISGLAVGSMERCISGVWRVLSALRAGCRVCVCVYVIRLEPVQACTGQAFDAVACTLIAGTLR